MPFHKASNVILTNQPKAPTKGTSQRHQPKASAKDTGQKHIVGQRSFLQEWLKGMQSAQQCSQHSAIPTAQSPQRNFRSEIPAAKSVQHNQRSEISAAKSAQQNQRSKISSAKSAQQNKRSEISTATSRRRSAILKARSAQLCNLHQDTIHTIQSAKRNRAAIFAQ